jgi:hypothetical protein
MISVPSPGWSSRILIEVVVGSGTCWYGGEDHEKRGIEVLSRFLFARRPIQSNETYPESFEVGRFTFSCARKMKNDVVVCEMWRVRFIT